MPKKVKKTEAKLPPSALAVRGYVAELVDARSAGKWEEAAHRLNLIKQQLPVRISEALAADLCFVGQLADVTPLRKTAGTLLEECARRTNDNSSAARLLNQSAQLAANRGQVTEALGRFSQARERATSANDRLLLDIVSVNQAQYQFGRGQVHDAIQLLSKISNDLPDIVRHAVVSLKARIAAAVGDRDARAEAEMLDIAENLAANPRSPHAALEAILETGLGVLRNAIIAGDRRRAAEALRGLEIGTKAFAATTDYPDNRTTLKLAQWAMAQLEYSIRFTGQAEIARSGRQISRIKLRVKAAFGNDSEVLRSLDRYQMLATEMQLITPSLTLNEKLAQVRANLNLSLRGHPETAVPDVATLESIFTDLELQRAEYRGETSAEPKLDKSQQRLLKGSGDRGQTRRPNTNRETLQRMSISELIGTFGQGEGDSGRAEVQVALMTQQIWRLTIHMREHPKDKGALRGLLLLIGQRRRMLEYLQRESVERYRAIIDRLGLRDTLRRR